MQPNGGSPSAAESPLAQERSRTLADLESWRAGDPLAFERIWNRYRPAIEAFAVRRIREVHNPAVRAQLDRDDIIQGAMRVVVAKIGQFEHHGPGSLFRWMETIVSHEVSDRVDYWASAKRDPNRERPMADQSDATGSGPLVPASRNPGPATDADGNERKVRLAAALAELPERDFRILSLRYYFRAEWEEIAREVGAQSADAVRKAHERILPTLGMKLKGLLPS